jgi:hypothetical protein
MTCASLSCHQQEKGTKATKAGCLSEPVPPSCCIFIVLGATEAMRLSKPYAQLNSAFLTHASSIGVCRRLLMALGGVDRIVRLLVRPPGGAFVAACTLTGHGDWIRSVAFTANPQAGLCKSALNKDSNCHRMEWNGT